jgi:ubiquinone/menaquinone biosynthesis C-methylase UbiE
MHAQETKTFLVNVGQTMQNFGSEEGTFMTEHIKAEGPNSDEIEYWNGAIGQIWTDSNRLLDRMFEPVTDLAIARAALMPGERVLDIGCGCGTTTLLVAERVAPGGAITALDVSTLMLAKARERAKSAPVPIQIINADAETHDFAPSSFDVMFSQLGVMFFTNPNTAFANFHRALKPGGRVVFVCWRDPDLNPWLMLPVESVLHLAPEGFELPHADAPASPFSFAPQERVEAILADAGFTDVRHKAHKTNIRMGEGDLNDCADLALKVLSPIRGILNQASDSDAPAVVDAVRAALAPYHTGSCIELAGSVWVVSARRP